MKDDKVTFSDDFNQGFGFGLGFCLAISIYSIGWALLIWTLFSEMVKRPLP